MPIVNYVREHIRFIEYATDEHLTSSERLLWYALMHIMNQRAQGNVWPEEFIRISNDRLLSYCPMKYDTMAAARNSLKQRGLIEFVKGEKGRQSPAYRMIYFYPQYAPPNTEQDGDIPNFSDYLGDHLGDYLGDHVGDKLGGQPGDNNINYTDKPVTGTEPVTETEYDPEDDDEDDSGGIERPRAEVRESWRRRFGAALPPGAVWHLAQVAMRCGTAPGMIDRAIQRAAIRAPDSPVDYVAALLCDWGKHNVRSVDDLDRYAALVDAAWGHFTPKDHECDPRIKEFREERAQDDPYT